MNGADRIARSLAAAGCRFAFGIPGGEVLALVEALDRAGLRVLTARHETAAGFMAEGAWHATGAPGVLVATIGPGVANTVNVIANAQQDRVPLLVLTGCLDEAETASYTHQIFDHRAVLRPITKASLLVAEGAIEVAIARALALATADPPGPVHLDLPIRVATSVAPELGPVHPPRSPRATVSPAITAELRARIGRAQRPLLIAGVEALSQQAEESVARFVRETGVPCLSTYKAKGIVDERDVLSLGAAGLSPRADGLLLPLVRAADVVVLAGYDPIEMRRPWQHPFGDEAVVIDLSSGLALHGMHHATHALVGDIAAHLDALASPEHGARWPEGEIARARAALRAAFAPEVDTFGPFAIAHALEDALPADALVTVDTGAHRIAVSQAFSSRAPRSMLQSAGLCTMGYALPTAIGYKVARPERPVVAVVGDGGLDMTLGELATARDLGAAVVVVVIDDASLALIELKQRKEGLSNVAVDSGRTRYAAVAEALGCRGLTATNAEELRAALLEGLLSVDRPTVIHVPIARRAYDGRL